MNAIQQEVKRLFDVSRVNQEAWTARKELLDNWDMYGDEESAEYAIDILVDSHYGVHIPEILCDIFEMDWNEYHDEETDEVWYDDLMMQLDSYALELNNLCGLPDDSSLYFGNIEGDGSFALILHLEKFGVGSGLNDHPWGQKTHPGYYVKSSRYD